MTQQKGDNGVDLAARQAASAQATIANIEAEQALSVKEDEEVAKVFYSIQPGASMQMMTKTGRAIIFRDGKCITKRPEEIAYLMEEIKAGNSSLSRIVDEVQGEKSIEERIKEAEKAAVERYIRQTQGASSNAGVSDNTGAGVFATSVNAAVLPGAAPATALDMLRQKANAPLASEVPVVAQEVPPEPQEAEKGKDPVTGAEIPKDQEIKKPEDTSKPAETDKVQPEAPKGPTGATGAVQLKKPEGK